MQRVGANVLAVMPAALAFGGGAGRYRHTEFSALLHRHARGYEDEFEVSSEAVQLRHRRRRHRDGNFGLKAGANGSRRSNFFNRLGHRRADLAQ